MWALSFCCESIPEHATYSRSAARELWLHIVQPRRDDHTKDRVTDVLELLVVPCRLAVRVLKQTVVALEQARVGEDLWSAQGRNVLQLTHLLEELLVVDGGQRGEREDGEQLRGY